MLFHTSLTIPSETTKKDFISTKLKITSGIVKRLTVFFPWGCGGLAGIRVFYAESQLMPISRNQWLIGNDILHDYLYSFNIDTEPYELTIHGYNNDDTFNHTPIITAEITRPTISDKLRLLLNEL